MKRLLLLFLIVLGLSFSIKAQEKGDSLKYYYDEFYVAYQSGNLQNACFCIKNTLRLYKEIMGDVSHDISYASAGNTYATLCYQTGDYEAAINTCIEVCNIYRYYGTENLQYATSINMLALCYSALGNYNEALRLGSEALEIIKNVAGTNHIEYAKILNNLALFYSNIGNYNEAIRLETEALDIKKEVLGTEHPDYALSLSNLASDYENIGNYNEAIRLETEALGITKRVLGVEHPDYASSLSNLASDYFSIGDYNESLRLDLEAKEIREKVLGTSHPLYANSLSNLSVTYSKLGNYQEAISLNQEVIRIRKEVLGTNHPDYALSLSNLASDYFSIGDYNESLRLDLEAKEIREKVLGTSHPDYASSLNSLAATNFILGNYQEAINLYKEVIRIRKEIFGTSHPDYANSLSNLSVTYSKLGNYQEAISLGNEVVEITKEILGTEHPDYAKSLNNLADVYIQLSNYNEALQLESEAMEIMKIVFGPEHPSYATSLNNVANIYYGLGNYQDAIRLESEAIDIIKKTLGKEHPDYARNLNNLAWFYSSIGDYDKALQLGTEALDINKRTVDENNPAYAQSLGILSKCHFVLGKNNEAIQLGIENARILKNALGSDHPNYATALGNLASYYNVIGNHEEAIRLGSKATEIRKRVFGLDNISYATSLGDLALYLSESEKYNESLPLLDESISLIRKNVLSTFSELSSNERQMYWNKFSFALNQKIPGIILRSGAPDAASLLYNNTALFAKGLLLSTELEMTKLIQERGDSEALQIYYELHRNRQILNAQYSKPISERHIDCDSLERVSTNLERQLVSYVKEFGDYTRNLSITWRDVQSKLNDDDIAIEFLSYTDMDGEIHYAALTLCKSDTAPILTPLFVESKLLETQRKDNTYHTEAADALIWGPLSSRLEGLSHIYFSASGMLHNIGIEYLPSMESKECYRLSSTRELVIHRQSPSISSATLYGDIDYDATYASIESSTPVPIRDYAMNTTTSRHRGMSDHRSINDGVDALPGTRVELKEVSALMKPLGAPCDTLMGLQASEESFKALSGQHRSLLHISTHGFYYNDEKANNLKPHLRQMLIGDDRPSYAEDRSLLRCGLCFAGANQALLGKSQPAEWQGDGILNALEIAQTDLRGLDLVVLSACQTALGDIAQGEGVFGLQRGFKKAGAKSILMSLWKVNDLTTQLLMTEFYKHYLSGQSKLESLMKAQEYVRNYKDKDGNKHFEDPYFWAGFILLDALD